MDGVIKQILAWRKQLERDPHQRLYHRIVDALLKSGRPAAALDMAEKGLFIYDKKYLACQEAQGAALLALGRYAEAAAALQPIVRQVSNVETRRKLVMALYGAGLDEEANKLGRELMNRDPFDNQVRRLLERGKEELPAPIEFEEPLPEEEPASGEDVAATIDHEPEAIEETEIEDDTAESLDVSEPTESDEELAEQAHEVVAEPAPEPEAVEEKEEQEPVEPEPSPEETEQEKPVAEGQPKVDSVTGHQLADVEKPLDASAAPEAEAALDQFFQSMKSDPAREEFSIDLDGSAAPEGAGDQPAQDGESSADEEKDAGVEEVDVFADLPGDPVEQPSAEANQDEEIVEPITQTDQTKQDSSVAEEPAKGRWRKLFRGRRRKKEEME